MAELPFIDRVRNPQNYPNPTKFDKEGRPQTHLLSADIDDKTGNWIVYPKLVIKDGKYVEQSMQDAINSGDSVNFGKDQDSAIEFSKTYKDELNPDFEKYYEDFRVKKEAGGEIQSLMDEIGIQPIGESSSFKMAMAVLSPEQKLKKIKLLKKYFDKMRQAESLQKPGAALGDLSDAKKLKQGIPYSSSKSIQKELDQLQGAEKLDLNLLAKLRKEFNI
jgi:hypothetical protein